MKVRQRIQAISVAHPLSTNKKIDQYLSENLPNLMDQYKLADKSDVQDVEKKFEDLEKRMEDLDQWKKDFGLKLNETDSRMGRLKYKYGVE